MQDFILGLLRILTSSGTGTGPVETSQEYIVTPLGSFESKLAYPTCGHEDCYLAWFFVSHYPFGALVVNN